MFATIYIKWCSKCLSPDHPLTVNLDREMYVFRHSFGDVISKLEKTQLTTTQWVDVLHMKNDDTEEHAHLDVEGNRVGSYEMDTSSHT